MQSCGFGEELRESGVSERSKSLRSILGLEDLASFSCNLSLFCFFRCFVISEVRPFCNQSISGKIRGSIG